MVVVCGAGCCVLQGVAFCSEAIRPSKCGVAAQQSWWDSGKSTTYISGVRQYANIDLIVLSMKIQVYQLCSGSLHPVNILSRLIT